MRQPGVRAAARAVATALTLATGVLVAAPTSASTPTATVVVPTQIPTQIPTEVDARIAAALDARVTPAAFGTRVGGQVVDAATGALVWGRDADRMLAPASTAKLVTASNAIAVLGPRHRVTTSVRRGATWAEVVLVGGGDPSLSRADLAVLTRTTAASLRLHRVSRVRVRFDDSLFAVPTPAAGWKADYVPTDVRAVRALVVDERHAADTALDAARVFAGQLSAAGIAVTAVGRGRAPVGAATIATVRGDRIDVMVDQMLLTSDNDHAEALHRLVALRAGQRATWAGAVLAQRSVLAGQGVVIGPTQLYDGSGLSLRDRLTARQLVQLVSGAVGSSSPVASSLPVAGLTGTLRASLGRFATAPSRCAVGRVHAKTGTLDQVVSLAGWTTGADGRVKAFAFVVNGAGDTLALKRRVDNLAATVTGCY